MACDAQHIAVVSDVERTRDGGWDVEVDVNGEEIDVTLDRHLEAVEVRRPKATVPAAKSVPIKKTICARPGFAGPRSPTTACG